MRESVGLGRHGEDAAAEFLGALGHRLVDRNWRCARGEIDLVTLDGRDLVFTEVKTRSSLRAGDPLEAITATKLRRMRVLAGLWMECHPERRGRPRLDVVGVLVGADGAAAIRHERAVGA